MKALVIFYSYTGNSKRLAQEFAARESADIVEIKDMNRPGKLKAYTLGCFAAMKGKSWPLAPQKINYKAYNRLIIFAPVWAGNPPPAINTILEMLPKSKTVSLKMISASGKSKCRDRLEAVLRTKGCTLDGFENIKA